MDERTKPHEKTPEMPRRVQEWTWLCLGFMGLIAFATLLDAFGALALPPALVVIDAAVVSIGMLVCWALGPRDSRTASLPMSAALLAILASSWSDRVGPLGLTVAIGVAAAVAFAYAVWVFVRILVRDRP